MSEKRENTKAKYNIKKENSHLLFTGDQQLPVDTYNNFYSMEVFISQFLITSLLKIGSYL